MLKSALFIAKAVIRWVVLKIFCSVQFASKLKCFETKKEVADDDKMLSVIGIIVVWLIREKTKIIRGYEKG